MLKENNLGMLLYITCFVVIMKYKNSKKLTDNNMLELVYDKIKKKYERNNKLFNKR